MRKSMLLALAGLILLAGLARPSDAQQRALEPRCFPATGQCIEGRFRDYWEQHGGLAVFGYPLTPARQEQNRDTGQLHLTQWFERARFELHAEHQPPYDVLLGRLGDDLLRAQGRDWSGFPKANPSAPHYFPQTGHAIPEVFWGYWSSHGLEFDGQPGVSLAESLALFGLPLSEAQLETNSSGDQVLTQWFERARFEHHPNNRPPYQVLLGRLGADVLATRLGAVEVVYSHGWGAGGATAASVLEVPADLTVDQQGHVWVADWGDPHPDDESGNHPAIIKRFSSQGVLLGQWGLPEDDFWLPDGLSIDQQGHLFVIHSIQDKLQKFSFDGQLLLEWDQAGGENFSFLADMAIDQTGQLYVTDMELNRVFKFNTQGQLLLSWGNQGSGPGQLSDPRSIAIDPLNQIYVQDDTGIQKFSAEGHFLGMWGDPVALEQAAQLTFDSLGYGYMIDSTDYDYRVLRLDREGRLLGAFKLPQNGEPSDPSHLAAGPHGYLYVTDERGERIFKLDQSQQFVLVWGNGGSSEDGQFELPTGVAVDPGGAVYVADLGNYRVQKFDPSGRFLLKWGSRGAGPGQFGDSIQDLVLALDTAGAVYVTDPGNRRVQKFSPQGQFLAAISVPGGEAPHGVAVDLQGNLYVSSATQVHKLAPGGELLASWEVTGKRAESESRLDLEVQVLVVVDGAGNFYVPTEHGEIEKYGPDGARLARWTIPGTGPLVRGLTLDEAGYLYVSDWTRHLVWKMSPDGRWLTSWGDHGTGPGQFARWNWGELGSGPRGLAVDGAGMVYVADAGNHRVQVFRQRPER